MMMNIKLFQIKDKHLSLTRSVIRLSPGRWGRGEVFIPYLMIDILLGLWWWRGGGEVFIPFIMGVILRGLWWGGGEVALHERLWGRRRRGREVIFTIMVWSEWGGSCKRIDLWWKCVSQAWNVQTFMLITYNEIIVPSLTDTNNTSILYLRN